MDKIPTAITIIPSVKRRKEGERLKQADHLEEARAVRDIRSQRRGEKWDFNNGRKSTVCIVQEWINKNPNGTKNACIRETGLTKPTVYKHWKTINATLEEKRKAEEAARVAALAKQAREMSAAMRSQIEAAEETAEKMRVLLESMPEGAERVKYQVQYDSLTANVNALKEIMTGDRPQEPQEGREQAEGLPGGEIPGGNV